MCPEPSPAQFDSHDGPWEGMGRSAPLMKIKFPKFDGSNPRLWRDRCDMYFEVYMVSPNLKTRFAALIFKGVAASWLQTLERRGRITDWEQFCLVVFSRFDKDQYQTHLRQLDSRR